MNITRYNKLVESSEISSNLLLSILTSLSLSDITLAKEDPVQIFVLSFGKNLPQGWKIFPKDELYYELHLGPQSEEFDQCLQP